MVSRISDGGALMHPLRRDTWPIYPHGPQGSSSASIPGAPSAESQRVSGSVQATTSDCDGQRRQQTCLTRQSWAGASCRKRGCERLLTRSHACRELDVSLSTLDRSVAAGAVYPSGAT